MKADCHIHMVLDGVNWKASIDRHRQTPDTARIRETLARYRDLGFTYLRDGGDRWNAGGTARALAPEYGITYRTPLAPLCMAGHYGGFIGEKFASFREYRERIRQHRADGCDFIKIMISGIMDFDRFGVMSEEPLPPEDIREMIRIAHEEGFPVMAHANGAETVRAAAEAGVDSVEHGAYLDDEALQAMYEAGTVWVPTLSAVGNLRGRGRFDEQAVCRILESTRENVRRFADMGGLLAPGTDAGAWAVPHGSLTEYALLEECLGADTEQILDAGIRAIRKKF